MGSVITITTPDDQPADLVVRAYDVRDLLPPGREMRTAALAVQIEFAVPSGQWANADFPSAPSNIRGVRGQLFVTATDASQYEVQKFLYDLRLTRSRLRFAQRAGALIGGAMVVTSLALITADASSAGGGCIWASASGAATTSAPPPTVARSAAPSQNKLGTRQTAGRGISLTTRAGFPATTVYAGTSLVTTEFAAMTAASPIVTPLRITARSPTHTSDPITTGRVSAR
jgi:hypothetical protein